MKRLLTYLFLIGISSVIFAQNDRDLMEKLKGYTNPEELVTLSDQIPFDQAIAVLDKVSEKLTGQKIVSTAGVTAPIGIEIDKMPYKKALTVIVQYHNLVYDEKPDVIVVRKKEESATAKLSEDVYAPVGEREVKITALFFEANVTEMRQQGINWQFLLSQTGLTIGGSLISSASSSSSDANSSTSNSSSSSGNSTNATPDFTVGGTSSFDMGKFSGNATALFNFFESENLGEIIARPTVTVRDKIQGRIQIGSDISIKERDFAGNLIDKFYSTGTIVEVTPYIYSEDGINYILLKLNVERSSATPGTISTEIAKTQATTSVLMLDGEETAIGGLFVNDETTVRRGIPFFKDLPWWVLGIRYLTGFDSKQVTKKEVIILIKADIVPTLKERVANRKKAEEENLIKKQHEENQETINKYKIDSLKKEDK